MEGFDEKRRSLKQELLRRALLQRVENSKDRSALYDVPTTRCSTQARGIPLTKDPQLVRNMQRNLSNSRWEPVERLLSGTSLAQREIAGCLKCGEATLKNFKKLCPKCRANDKVSRGSRASSLSYPSRWNLEMVEDLQVVDGRSAELSPSDITNCDALHRTTYNQRLADQPGGTHHQRKIDNRVQCSLRPMPKRSTIEDNSRIRQGLAKPRQKMCNKSIQSDMGYGDKPVSSSPNIVGMEHVIDASDFGKQRVISGEAESQSENACGFCCVWSKYPPGSSHPIDAAGMSPNNDGYTSSAIDSRASNSNESIKNQHKVGKMHYPTSEHLKSIEHISRPPTLMDTTIKLSRTIAVRKAYSVTQQGKYQSNQNQDSKKDNVQNSRGKSNEKNKLSSSRTNKNIGFNGNESNGSTEPYSHNPSDESMAHKQATANNSIQSPRCSNAMTQTEGTQQDLVKMADETEYKASKRSQFEKDAPPHPLNGAQLNPRGKVQPESTGKGKLNAFHKTTTRAAELPTTSRTAPKVKQTGKPFIVIRENHLAENCCQLQYRNCCKPIRQKPASSNPFIQLQKPCQCPACIKCRTKAPSPTINPARKPQVNHQMAKGKLEKVKTAEPQHSMPKSDVKVPTAKAKLKSSKAPENNYPDAESAVRSTSRADSNPSSAYSDASIKNKCDCVCHKCGAPIDKATRKAKTSTDSSNESHRHLLNGSSSKQLHDEIEKERKKPQPIATRNTDWNTNTAKEETPSNDYQRKCCTTDWCKNQCGKCRITPVKMKKGGVMANLVVDDKCDVSQIIEILRKTVADLEKQEQLLRQRISVIDQNIDIQSSASDSLPHTTSNYRYNKMPENYYKDTANYKTSQDSNQYNWDYHNEGYQGTGPNDMSYNSYPQQYKYYQQSNACNFGRNKQVQAELPAQLDYDHLQNESEQPISENGNSLVQCNCEDQAEIDYRGYSNENNNQLRITDSNARPRTRSGGNPDTFEKDLKTCTILSCDNKTCKTLQSLKPTQSFIQVFHMAMALRKNGTSFQKDPVNNSFFDTKLQRLKPEDQEAHVSLKHKMSPDHISYESHRLNGILAKKDPCEQPKRKRTQDMESVEHIDQSELEESTNYEASMKTDTKRKGYEYFRVNSNSKNRRRQQEQSAEDRFRNHSEQERTAEKDLSQKHFNQVQKGDPYLELEYRDNGLRQYRQQISLHKNSEQSQPKLSQEYAKNNSCDLDSCRRRNEYSEEVYEAKGPFMQISKANDLLLCCKTQKPGRRTEQNMKHIQKDALKIEDSSHFTNIDRASREATSKSSLSLCNEDQTYPKKSKSRSSFSNSKRRTREKKKKEELEYSEAKNSASIDSLAMCKWRKQEKKEEIRSDLLEPTKSRKGEPDKLEANTSKPEKSLSIRKKIDREKKEKEDDDPFKAKQSPSRSKSSKSERKDKESSQSEQAKRSKSKSFKFYSCVHRIKPEKNESVDCLEAKSTQVSLYQLKQKPKLADLFGSSNRSSKDKNRRSAPDPQNHCDDVKVLCDLSYRFSHHSYGDTEDDCVCDMG